MSEPSTDSTINSTPRRSTRRRRRTNRDDNFVYENEFVTGATSGNETTTTPETHASIEETRSRARERQRARRNRLREETDSQSQVINPFQS